MNFEQELKTLFEYADYDKETENVINLEIMMIREIYPELFPAAGWGEGVTHTISLKGAIPVTYNDSIQKVPFAICFTLNYPNTPPLCNIEYAPSQKIMPSKRVDEDGKITIGILRKWRSNKDSLEVIQKCSEYFSQHFPILDFGAIFLSEMWRIRVQIDDLIREKQALERDSKEIQRAAESLKKTISTAESERLEKKANELEQRIHAHKNSKFDVNSLFIFHSPLHEKLFEAIAEEEGYEEISRKLTETFYLKQMHPVDYITGMKQIFNKKFMAMKNREKLTNILQ